MSVMTVEAQDTIVVQGKDTCPIRRVKKAFRKEINWFSEDDWELAGAIVQQKHGTAITLGSMCFYSKAHFEAVTTRDIWQWWLPNTCNWKTHNCSGSLLTRGQREGKGRGSFPGVSKRKDCHWDLGGGDLWKKGKGTWDKGWGIMAFEALPSVIMTGSQSIRSRRRLSFSWTGLF